MSEETYIFGDTINAKAQLEAEAAAEAMKPTLFEDRPLPLEDSVASIPEVQACVTLMRDAMREMRQRKDLAPFIRKQQLKLLQLDYLKLGGRLKALSKLLTALDEHPDYYEVQEDVKDCVRSLALLIQHLEKHYKLDVGAWCREHFPLTPEQEAERDAYETELLAKKREAEDVKEANVATASAEYGTGEIVGDDAFTIPAKDCSDEGICVNVPDCGDEGIFAHADEIEGLLGDYVAEPESNQMHDHSNDPIDLDV